MTVTPATHTTLMTKPVQVRLRQNCQYPSTVTWPWLLTPVWQYLSKWGCVKVISSLPLWPDLSYSLQSDSTSQDGAALRTDKEQLTLLLLLKMQPGSEWVSCWLVGWWVNCLDGLVLTATCFCVCWCCFQHIFWNQSAKSFLNKLLQASAVL